MMEFSQHMAFWGLLAIAVPTIVLLLSKKKQEVVNFPSLKFLKASESKSARSIFPSQWLLWLLRALMISAFVLMLAKPLFEDKAKNKKIYVEKDVFEDPLFSTVLSSLDREVEVFNPESLWTFAEKLNRSSDSSVVYTRNYEKDFRGKPVKLAEHVEWRIVPLAHPVNTIDTSLIKNQHYTTSISSGELGLKWNSEELSKTDSGSNDSIRVKIIASLESAARTDKFKSILGAYSEVLPLSFSFNEEAFDWIVSIDTLITDTGRNLIEWQSHDGPLDISRISKAYFAMQGDISSATLSSSDFAIQLAHVFLSDHMKLDEMDKRTSSAPRKNTPQLMKAKVKKSERRFYWWSVILVLLLIERWYSRKLQGE